MGVLGGVAEVESAGLTESARRHVVVPKTKAIAANARSASRVILRGRMEHERFISAYSVVKTGAIFNVDSFVR